MAVNESKNPSSLKIKLDLGMVDGIVIELKKVRK